MERQKNAYYNIPYINIDQYEFAEEIKLFSDDFAKRNNVIPMELKEKILTVCMGTPSEELLHKVEMITKKKVMVFKSEPEKVEKIINLHY